MNWLRRLLAWLLPLPIDVLLTEATAHGEVTVQQVAGELGVEWQVAIRARGPVRYAWSFSSPSVVDAVRGAMREAEENPIQRIVGTPCRPKLGGVEFDPE